MVDYEFLSPGEFDSTCPLLLSSQAECLLSVIVPMLQAMQETQLGSIDSALQLYEARKTFRECVETACHGLDVEQTQDLLVLTIMGLCEGLTSSVAHRDV